MKDNEEYINNPAFKIMTIVNGISYFVQTKGNDLETFFNVFTTPDAKKQYINGIKPQNNQIPFVFFIKN